MKHFGDIFIDFSEKTAWGIDGIIVQSSEFTANHVNLTIHKLPEKKSAILKARELLQDQIEIIINKISLGLIDKAVLEAGVLKPLTN